VDVSKVKADSMGVTSTSEVRDVESATKKVRQRILVEPDYRAVLYKVLVFCETARSYPEIWHEIVSFPEMKSAIQSPPTFLTWLVEAGGIEQVAVDEEEKKEPTWRTTQAGRKVVLSESPGNRLAQLLSQEPVYRETFRQVLRSCVVPKSRGEIEAMLRGSPVVENPKVYASFFTETLERAGGLEWNEKWQTTETGKTFVNSGDLSNQA
jgi:hypothetical protein